MTSGIAQEGLKRRKAEKLDEGITYTRFRESYGKITRGTVIVGNRVIWGFPHIKRIFTLENGLKRNIAPCSIYAEEKIDGFNIRIALIGGKIFAFSRGGFIDPFVSEKAREMGLAGFFKEYPGHVLCGEMIGNTPYTKPVEDFDVRLFVFDIDAGDGTYLPCGRRYEILKRFGILCVPVLGKLRSDDYAGFRRLALSLNKGRKEGMVLKSEDRGTVLKYVTAYSDIEDIENATETFFDMPIGFYYQRVLRSGFFISDFGLDKSEYADKLGKAFYNGLIKAVGKAREGREIDEEFEFFTREAKVWDGVRKHMGKEVAIEELSRREENGGLRIRFRKIYRKTTRTLQAYAGGKGATD